MRSLRSLVRALAAIAILVTVLAIASPAAAGGGPDRLSTLDVTLGVFFDPEGTVCSGTITPGTPGTVYVVARSAPGTEIISGAEFRFTGLPPAWTVYSVPNPLCFSLGDPFANGVTIAATGNPGQQCDPVWATFLMYTVIVFAAEEVNDVVFELTNREPPSNAAFRCPLVTDCSVAYEKYCVQTSPCFVNSSTAPPCREVTAVEHVTWTSVREMYR